MTRPDAILLLGPTGSGKTPLGEWLQQRGLWGRPCRHFDFGQRLREIVAGRDRPAGLSDADIAFLADVLDRGALLEDEHFPIARSILRAFLDAGDSGTDAGIPGQDQTASRLLTGNSGVCPPSSLIVLNGLPRHLGQARDVDALVAMRAVVHLACTPQVVLERIRTDAGGDRAGRTDDRESAVRAKLDLYERRILPLRDHYRLQGAADVTLTVAASDSPEEIRGQIPEIRGQIPEFPAKTSKGVDP